MASSSHQPQPAARPNPNPNPNPMGPPSSISKRPRSPSLDPSEAKQPRSYLQVLGKEVGTQDNKRPPKGTKMVMPKMCPIHNQLALEKKGVETEEKEDKVENPGKGKKKVVKISPAINHAHKPVNSSKCGKPFPLELLVKSVMTNGPPIETLETGLYRFCRDICPDVQLPSINELKQDCIRVHQKEKAQLKEILKKHRVCLSFETWSDVYQMYHMSIRAHWVNEEWKLCNKVLTFHQVPYPFIAEDSESVEELGEIWYKCLEDWGIESVLTVTVGKTSTEDAALEYLKNKTKDKIGTVMGHKFLHLKSCAHIISEVVKEGLEAEKDTVRLIRNTVKFVGLGERYEHFKECARKENLEYQGRLFFSVDPIWDSVYMMLEKTTKLQKAFERLMKEDSLYLSCFYPPEEDEEDYDFWGNKIEKEVLSGPPTEKDWENARRLAKLLRLFYKVMRRLSDPLRPASTTFLKEVVGMRIRLAELSGGEDQVLGSLAKRMKKKFDEYWGNLFDLNPLFDVAEVLDPWRKLQYLRFYLSEIGIESTLVVKFVEKIEATLVHLFEQYLEFETGPPCPELDIDYVSKEEDYSERLNVQFSKLIVAKEWTAERALELELYLTARCETGDPSFDLLDWWKANCLKYPVLSKIAMDVLAIPASASFYEQAFYTDYRELVSHKSSLSDNLREALICGEDWFMDQPPPADFKEAVIDEMALDDEEEIQHGFY